MTKTTNFQTSFCVTGDDIPKVYTGMKRVVFQWLTGKEKDPILKGKKLDFFKRVGPLKNLDQTNASIQTDYFLNNDEKRWAVRYSHPDQEARRFWYVDIGLTQKPDRVVFSIAVAYAWQETYLGDQSTAPSPNIPWVVNGILENAENHGWACYSGDPSIPITRSPLSIVNPGEGRSVWDMIANHSRRIPLIVVNGANVRDIAEYLAARLQGKAVIVHITDNDELAQEIRHYIPHDMAIRHGTIRVFFPVRPQARRPKRHRFFDPKSDTFEGDQEMIVQSILKNYTLREPDSTTDIIDIGSRIKRLKLTQELMAAVSSADASDEEKNFLLNELDAEYDRKLREKDEELQLFVDESGRLEDELNEAQLKLIYHQSLANTHTQSGTPVLKRGEVSDLFNNEIAAIIDACLRKFQTGFPEDGRIWTVIEDLIQANPVDTSSLKPIHEAIDSVFKGGYRKLSKKNRQQLASCGLTVTGEGKHYKMHFDGHPQYTVTFAKTASDHRSGENIIRSIKTRLGIGSIDV